MNSTGSRLKSWNILPAAVMAVALSVTAFLPGPASAQEYGVYQYVVTRAEGSIDEIYASLVEAANISGWKIAGTTDSGDPDKCSYLSRVIVLYDAEYAGDMIKANPSTGAFAALDRVNIFQDENGTHVSVVDPRSINRTILMDDTGYSEISAGHLERLRSMILTAVKGTESSAGYGQVRSEGYIGKTMGVVAGGDFDKLVKDKYKAKEGTVAETGRAVGLAFAEPTNKWGLKLVYEIDIPGSDIYVLGVSGAPMDTKSFQIVSHGQDESRKEFACPGLSHAGAYPIEIVVMKDGDGVKVVMVDVMYRMKMYFEDAGTTAFMKNMKMPGSIDKEIRKQIKKALED